MDENRIVEVSRQVVCCGKTVTVLANWLDSCLTGGCHFQRPSETDEERNVRGGLTVFACK